MVSQPEGAFVYVNGKFIGNSPVDVRLNRQVPHRVEVRKAGFVTQEVMVYPSYTGDEKPTVQFGPLRSAGYYRDLDPNPVQVELLYDGLGESSKTINEAEAEALYDRINEELVSGTLTPDEAEFAASQVETRLKSADIQE